MKKLRISSVPRPLYEAMVKEAKDNDRTISEEIVAALQRRCPNGNMEATIQYTVNYCAKT